MLPDIKQVLDHYGADYRGYSVQEMVPCVFHEDRNPSMRVRFDENVWKCFSCGEGGNSLQLVMKKEGLDARRAEEFCTSHGIDSIDADGGKPPVQLASGLGAASSRAQGDQRGGRKYVRFRRGTQ